MYDLSISPWDCSPLDHPWQLARLLSASTLFAASGGWKTVLHLDRSWTIRTKRSSTTLVGWRPLVMTCHRRRQSVGTWEDVERSQVPRSSWSCAWCHRDHCDCSRLSRLSRLYIFLFVSLYLITCLCIIYIYKIQYIYINLYDYELYIWLYPPLPGLPSI